MFSVMFILCSLRPIPIEQSWQFDLWSALIGAGMALLLTALAYHLREELRLGWEGVKAPAIQLRDQLEAGTEERYRDLVVTWARSRSPFSRIAPLDAIFVEPEFAHPPAPPESPERAELSEPQTLSLSQIWGGHPQLVVKGASGAGKTAVLTYLALECAKTVDGEGLQTPSPMSEVIQGRLPLYISLSAMGWAEEEEEGGEQEEAEVEAGGNGVERLLNAAATSVGGSTRLTALLRQYLEVGRAIMLIDGWDVLTEQQRQRAASWISELTESLPDNLWLVAAGTRGYAPLTEAGFAPITISPWGIEQVEAFAEKWVEIHTPAEGEPPVAAPVLASELWEAGRTNPLPLMLTLQAFVRLADEDIPNKRTALFDRTLDLLLEQEEGEEVPWLPATCRTTLGKIALRLQQEERALIGKDELTDAIEDALPPGGERPSRAVPQVLEALTGERGVLRPADSGSYAFVHPMWRAFLAARRLVVADPARLIDRLDDPRWSEVLRFYAELGEVEPLVETLLERPDDLFYSRLRTLGSWASAAPRDAVWLEQVMSVLARQIFRPDLPPSVRQALARAVAKTDVSGIQYLFKRALEDSNVDVRHAAVVGLGEKATTSDLPLLNKALSDEASVVREEAVRVLAQLDSDAAARRLERVLREEDDTVRAVAAEALVKSQGERSLSLLREMTESDDVATRRAAVFGLAELGERDSLEDLVRQEEQWIVRSAAEMALEYLEEQEKISGVTPPPSLDELSWLISWAASQGESVGTGKAAREMLWRALREGEASVRLAAAQVLVQIGRPEDVDPLRATLDDPDPAVADTALKALQEISARYGLRIE